MVHVSRKSLTQVGNLYCCYADAEGRGFDFLVSQGDGALWLQICNSVDCCM